MNERTERIQSGVRQEREKAREKNRDRFLITRRFSHDEKTNLDPPTLAQLLSRLKSDPQGRDLLNDLKICLAAGEENPDDFFGHFQAQSWLVGHLASPGPLQHLACQVVANLAPLNEKNGIQFARSVGPYLVNLVSSGSGQVQEASCVALGNLALSGRKVVRVMVNQEVTESILGVLSETSNEGVKAAGFYALYHILHTYHSSLEKSVLSMVSRRCQAEMSVKCPLELHWVLFVLSCDNSLHSQMHASSFIHRALDICTYEIFQKSDSRPLVKIVTPIVRVLANLCAGPYAESSSLSVLRYPDLPAIMMALLGTNYSHLCKETLWLFSNIINSESVLVQEELIELDIMDKMEYHTGQAIQKIDPYLSNSLNSF